MRRKDLGDRRIRGGVGKKAHKKKKKRRSTTIRYSLGKFLVDNLRNYPLNSSIQEINLSKKTKDRNSSLIASNQNHSQKTKKNSNEVERVKQKFSNCYYSVAKLKTTTHLVLTLAITPNATSRSLARRLSSQPALRVLSLTK